MLLRVRRWIAVMLSLALLPTVSGGAQCASHGSGAITVGEESIPSSAQAAASRHQHAGHELHTHGVEDSGVASPQVSQQDAAQVAVHAEAQAKSHVPTHITAEQAPQDCCPPTSVPGACSSAMGCGVVIAAETEVGSVAFLANTAVAAAPGSVLPPGPSRAPNVPPPRA